MHNSKEAEATKHMQQNFAPCIDMSCSEMLDALTNAYHAGYDLSCVLQ